MTIKSEDEDKTRAQLIEELAELRRFVSELKAAEAEKEQKEALQKTEDH